MANFNSEIPSELIKQFEELDLGATDMMMKMTRAGAELVYSQIKMNLSKAFNKTDVLSNALKITKSYKNSKDEISTKVGFYGYDKSKKSKKYPKGVPIPLIVLAREYGTSSGEAKIPILRPAFNKKNIENVMLKVQDEYIKKG